MCRLGISRGDHDGIGFVIPDFQFDSSRITGNITLSGYHRKGHNAVTFNHLVIHSGNFP